VSDRRRLEFRTEVEVLAEVARLRRGWRRRGNWTLPQVAWHLASLIEKFLESPADPAARRTPQQEALKAGFVDYIIAHGKPPPHATTAPPAFTPPSSATDADIDRFEHQLRRLKAYPHALVEMGPIGPVAIEECRACHLAHAAHHLSFIEPADAPDARPARRAGLAFADEAAVIADVQRLRKGYTMTGEWSLPRMAWHLSRTTQSRMIPGPFPPNTPEQDGRRPVLEQVLASGKLPDGIVAPDSIQPPADCGPEAIDELLDTLRRFASFAGPIAPHRLFGALSDADGRRLNRYHCAHHLSHLVPAGADGAETRH
jgi:hypothetical protein